MRLLAYVPQMAAYGGMERHVCLLLEAVARAGHTVSFLTTSDSLAAGWRQRLRAAGIDFAEMPVPRGRAGGLAKAWWLWRQAGRRRRTPWDIIYTNGQGALARLAWRAAHRQTRRIHHHHTAADAAEQQTWGMGHRAVLARAGELVGCSRFTAANLDAATGRRDSRFLPYWTETAFTAGPPPERHRQPGDPLRFGFLGRLVPTKGIDTILRLAEDPLCAAIEWHIHGAGPDYPAARFAGRPRLHYHGPYASPDEQAAALAGLDAVALLTHHNEGMPLSLIEAMAAGLPWVASDRGGTRELARSPTDCELLANPADYGQCRTAVLALAGRIAAGATSRRRQRAVWEGEFAPAAVGRAWFEYFGLPAPGFAAGPSSA
jgi:glycosyltransferase involved in cell wall biosynthesis